MVKPPLRPLLAACMVSLGAGAQGVPIRNGQVAWAGMKMDVTGTVSKADRACREVIYYTPGERGPSRLWGCWKDPKRAPAQGATVHVQGVVTGAKQSAIGPLITPVPRIDGL